MMTFEEVRNQLSSKICMGSQGDILTEKVMQLIDAAVHDERNAAQAAVNKSFVDGYEKGRAEAPSVALDPSARLIEFGALEKIATECMEGVSKPAKTAILHLMAEVSSLVEA